MVPLTPTPMPARITPPRPRKGARLLDVLRTTDPKRIALMYLVTTFALFMLGGAMALLMRAELARPGMQFLSTEQYNQLFTMHGTIMLLLFATPLSFGFANYIVPLQIGAPDVAFPRLNAFSFWLLAFGSVVVVAGFLTPGGAADFGWTAYAPLQNAIHSPGPGGDLWAAGLVVTGLGTILGAVNFVTTVVCLRAPGMTMFRLPMFTWMMLFTSLLILVAFPPLTAALLAMEADRHLGAHVFDPETGGLVLWQHLFWFFGHPEVYIVALPFFGIISEVIPVFARKPLFGYKGMVFAGVGITMLSVVVWAHHMYATGAIMLSFFSFTTFLIAIPTGIKFVNWIGTMWKGRLTFETPMLFAAGFLVTFLFGGLTGVLLASPPLDFHVSDTYFVVAHFHYVLFGTIVFSFYSGIYFWFPKMTGRFLDERLGKIHFWLTFVGFHLTFLVQHWLGNEGMPRRYADYLPSDGFTVLNTISTVGAFLLGASTLPFVWNVVTAHRFGRQVHADDPWGFANSLEWATTCPPPRHNFYELPRIRSERPAFDLHYPHLATRVRTEAIDTGDRAGPRRTDPCSGRMGHVTLCGRNVRSFAEVGADIPPGVVAADGAAVSERGPEPDMITVLTVETPGLGDRSYLAHDGEVALVVDPQRDHDRVRAVAAEAGVRITHVFESHIHNDYVTGGFRLARATGAQYLLNADDPVSFERVGVRDGQVVEVGTMRVRVLHTPGHTHTHLSFAVSDGSVPGAEPTVVFTGGSLLYGSTGRPDLLGPDHTDTLAHAQWHSARRLAAELPDATEIFPTHGFGSFCSATQATGTASTIGAEKAANPALTREQDEWVRELLAGLDAFPAYYAHMGPANSEGPDEIDLSAPAEADPAELRRRIDAGEWVVDLRTGTAFAAGHVAGTVNIGLGGEFVTYLGWLMPWGTPVTLLGESPADVADAQRELVRIGVDRPAAAATGKPEDWTGPTPLRSFRQATFADLAAEYDRGARPSVLDVRRNPERADGFVEGSVGIPIHEVLDRIDEVPAGPVWVHCAGGYRAAVVAGLLDARGIEVVAIDDAFGNAAAAGLPVVAG